MLMNWFFVNLRVVPASADPALLFVQYFHCVLSGFTLLRWSLRELRGGESLVRLSVLWHSVGAQQMFPDDPWQQFPQLELGRHLLLYKVAELLLDDTLLVPCDNNAQGCFLFLCIQRECLKDLWIKLGCECGVLATLVLIIHQLFCIKLSIFMSVNNRTLYC